MNIRLAKPYLGNRQELITLIENILDTGYLTRGTCTSRFEKQVADFLGVRHAIAVSSGTAALHLSLVVLDIGPGDEVIVPAYTFTATANAVELVGAIPVLVDVGLDSFNIDVKSIERAINPNTKAIIPVHLFGNPVDMSIVMQLANDHGLVVVEDAAGAFGAEFRGEKCGTIGNTGCFSFHPRKVPTTGEGGMIVTDDDYLAEKILALCNHGMSIYKGKTDFTSVGFNYRMSELEAALGVIQMKEIETIISKRQELANHYLSALENFDVLAYQETLKDCFNVWQAFVVRLENENNCQVVESLKNSGIEANIGTYAIHLLKYYATKYGYKPDDFPNASEMYYKGLALPFHHDLSLSDIAFVMQTLRNVLTRKTA